LAQRRDGHPLAGLAVEPQLRLLIPAFVKRPPIGDGLRCVSGQGEEQ
jgi:hypothetical protein